jgi:hypothetical protein
VVSNSEETPVPGGAVVTIDTVVVVELLGPVVVVVTTDVAVSVVVVAVLGTAVDDVLDAGGDVDGGTVVMVD